MSCWGGRSIPSGSRGSGPRVRGDSGARLRGAPCRWPLLFQPSGRAKPDKGDTPPAMPLALPVGLPGWGPATQSVWRAWGAAGRACCLPPPGGQQLLRAWLSLGSRLRRELGGGSTAQRGDLGLPGTLQKQPVKATCPSSSFAPMFTFYSVCFLSFLRMVPGLCFPESVGGSGQHRDPLRASACPQAPPWRPDRFPPPRAGHPAVSPE